jgi:pimeloyl-ACP methyl ester carboxylesterase
VGEHDDKFIKIAYRMGEKIPRSRISLIENCGHSVHLESPEDIATLLQSTATGK